MIVFPLVFICLRRARALKALLPSKRTVLIAPFSPWRSDLFGVPYAGYQFALAAFFAIVTIAEVMSRTASRKESSLNRISLLSSPSGTLRRP